MVNKSSARYYEKTKKDNKTAIYGRVRYINLLNMKRLVD